ncbi:MAG: Uma2 family endonuclease [Gammaproteobacteria bacterium]
MATVTPQKHRINLDEWRRMGEAGIFPPESRIELIDGEIIEMSPIGFNHAGHVTRLMNFFAPLLGNKALMTAQNPVQLGDLSEPEPDFMLLKPEASFYSTRHPQADDVLLLVEIADTSLSYDRSQKMRLYAAHNIPEYWMLNLNGSSLEVYRQPQPGGYAEKAVLHRGDTVQPVSLQHILINVADIL